MRLGWVWFAFVAACGTGHAFDELPPDAAPITVTVYDNYGPDPAYPPYAGVTVDFLAPDGSVQHATTDASGVAVASSPAGTTVLVHVHDELGPLIKAFLGAVPGDAILAGKWAQQAFDDLGDITFELPTHSGAALYGVTVSCGPSSTTLGGAMHVLHVTGCADVGNATATAWGVDANGALVTGASLLTGLDLATLVGTTVTMPAYDAAPATITAELANLPTSGSWDAEYFAGADLMPFAVDATSTVAPGGTTQLAMLGVGDRTISAVFAGPVHCEDAIAARATDVQLDFADAIRSITSPTFDPATQTLGWTEGVGAPPTIVHAILIGSVGRVDVHAPYTGASIALPDLGITSVQHLEVKGQIAGDESYDEILQTCDTHPGFDPVGDPSFVGRLWIASE
jgi:hypothetical protein